MFPNPLSMNPDTITRGGANSIQRETALAKVRTSEAQLDDLVSLVRQSGARVLDVSPPRFRDQADGAGAEDAA